MSGQIQIAWEGFSGFLSNGKYVGLLAAACIVLGMRRNRLEHKALWVYGAFMLILCSCPVTAAVLMKYQTNYYAYEWVWSLVPMTALIAWAGVLILREAGQEKSHLRQGAAVVFLGALVVLSGNLTGRTWSDGANCRPFVKQAVLEIKQSGQNKDICLWAPKLIVEYARSVDGDVKLAYGRDIWDTSLNAYSYDTYGPEEAQLYAWMSQTEEQCRGRARFGNERFPIDYAGLAECLALAEEMGVTHVLLPGLMDEEPLRERLAGRDFAIVGRIDSPGDLSEEGYYLLQRR